MNTFCSYFNQDICRSCDLLNLEYVDQIHLKETTLKTALNGLSLPKLLDTIPSPLVNFRNKAKLVVTGTMENPILGLWGVDNLDQGRELLNCPLHSFGINDLLPKIKEFISLCKLVPYQISTRKGELKSIIVFSSNETHEYYLRLVVRSKESIDRIKKNHHFLTETCSGLKCISVNIQSIPHAVLEGEEEIFITANTSINHQLGDISFTLGPKAFVQTNQIVAQKLYQTAAEWVRDSKLSKFMELFCGQGPFSFFCAPHITEGLGIEINPDAVSAAKKNARKYNYLHLNFKSADAAHIKDEIINFDPEIILVNPPRRGLSATCEHLLYHSPQMIIYSSCNYESLRADLEKLSVGYDIVKMKIFDMFPHTKHFEILVQLIHKD